MTIYAKIKKTVIDLINKECIYQLLPNQPDMSVQFIMKTSSYNMKFSVDVI